MKLLSLFFIGLSLFYLPAPAQEQELFHQYTSAYQYWLREEQGLAETRSLVEKSLGHFSLLPQIALHQILQQPQSPWKLYAVHEYNSKGERIPPPTSSVPTSKNGDQENLYLGGHFFLYRDDINNGPRLVVTFGTEWDWERLIGTVSISYSSNGYLAAVELAQAFRQYAENKNPYKGAILHIGSQSSYQFHFLENTNNFEFTWDDLILHPETKAQAQQLIQVYLENQKEFRQLGIATKQGVVLAGPPGTGKSFLAQILMNSTLRGELKDQLTLIVVNARHLQNPSGLNTLFQAIKPLGTVCIFMEDIDLFGVKNRNNNDSKSTEKAEVLLNELLNSLDGITENNNVLVIGTTNLIENVDEALLRSERLGFHLYFGLPRLEERKEFFNRFGKKKAEWVETLTVEWLALKTESFSGADILEIIGLAKRFAYLENSWKGEFLLLTPDHFQKAISLAKETQQSSSITTYKNKKSKKDSYTKAIKKFYSEL